MNDDRNYYLNLIYSITKTIAKLGGKSEKDSETIAKSARNEFDIQASSFFSQLVSDGVDPEEAEARVISVAGDVVAKLKLRAHYMSDKSSKKTSSKQKNPKIKVKPAPKKSSEPVVTAKTIVKNAKKPGRRPALGDEQLLDLSKIIKDAKNHHLRLWLCSGPKATGCGGSTSKNRSRVRMNFLSYPKDSN